ncbi:MAG: hypothetical protein ACJ73D_02805 [Pyrinomonadaceae bacterium]
MARLYVVFLLIVVVQFSSCKTEHSVNSRLASQMPQKILWAWEMPEDMSFADPKEFGVAFLSQTIFLQNDRVIPKKRQQPLKMADGAYAIAVTRIETYKETEKRPKLSPDMVRQTAEGIVDTLQLRNVKAIQIDFDAVFSERDFYRKLINEVRNHLPPSTPLTMTSLASWCTGDAWFNDFPVDEAVPMVFQMGADSDRIKRYLANGNDWAEPLCRGSYGISLEEGRFDGMTDGRRMYYFKNTPWISNDLGKLH